MQVGTMMQSHPLMTHFSYETIERMTKDLISGIQLSDKERANFLTCAQGTQDRNDCSKKDLRMISPSDKNFRSDMQ